MNAASRRPTPRPVFDRPTLIPATDRARHIWGDSASGFVIDRVYVSSQMLHVLEFSMPPGGRFGHSRDNPTNCLHLEAGDAAVLPPGTTARWLAVERVGVGVPEYVTPQGRINRALIVPSLQALPAATVSGIPIVVGSDVRCAARAESRLGHGRGLPSFVFVIIGTGISSTLVIDGRMWPGHRRSDSLGGAGRGPGPRPASRLADDRGGTGRRQES